MVIFERYLNPVCGGYTQRVVTSALCPASTVMACGGVRPAAGSLAPRRVWLVGRG